ncbi:putative transposase [Phytophthora citrophthora]|uniref:Transposase n=1 Tax=Phytophthora citrophthora TaxID=4793 RepID=A0AAD9GY41_9STRA|nr:putative transposase [Phytophthora citrophthora]
MQQSHSSVDYRVVGVTPVRYTQEYKKDETDPEVRALQIREMNCRVDELLGAETVSLLALEHFDNTARWPCDREKHESKRVTFESKPQRAAEISGYTATINVLKCNATDHADDIEAASAIRGELKAQDKLLTTRMRKYQLFPTTKQSQQLIRYMGTCRWTYNQAVAHFRATNVSKAATLRDLYVTQVSNKQRVYPEGMEPPPQWVYETPKSFRFNALRKFESSVKSAFSNPSTGNIKKFKVRFKSRKTDGRYFTFCEDASLATIQHRRGQRALLSISKLKGIQIRYDLGLVITNEIQITNTNGFWYATGIDPGSLMPKSRWRSLKNIRGHRSGRQWRVFTRAKRAFHCATAKLKNAVKEMHYQTAAYLTKTYDVIILPVFSSKDMVKRSTARNYTSNRLLLGLKHFQFRQILKAKCELMGKTLVICSEMYTSQTYSTSNSEAEMSFIAPIVITLRGEMSTLHSTFSGLSALGRYRRINNEQNSLNTTEVLEGKRYSEQADIYSFGVVLSELDTGKAPYCDAVTEHGGMPKPFYILQDVMAGRLRPTFSQDCPLRIKSLGLACLALDATRRPTAEKLVQMLLQQD